MASLDPTSNGTAVKADVSADTVDVFDGDGDVTAETNGDVVCTAVSGDVGWLVVCDTISDSS